MLTPQTYRVASSDVNLSEIMPTKGEGELMAVRSGHQPTHLCTGSIKKLNNRIRRGVWHSKVRFQLTHYQGLRQMFLMVSWDLSD